MPFLDGTFITTSSSSTTPSAFVLTVLSPFGTSLPSTIPPVVTVLNSISGTVFFRGSFCKPLGVNVDAAEVVALLLVLAFGLNPGVPFKRALTCGFPNLVKFVYVKGLEPAIFLFLHGLALRFGVVTSELKLTLPTGLLPQLLPKGLEVLSGAVIVPLPEATTTVETSALDVMSVDFASSIVALARFTLLLAFISASLVLSWHCFEVIILLLQSYSTAASSTW